LFLFFAACGVRDVAFYSPGKKWNSPAFIKCGACIDRSSCNAASEFLSTESRGGFDIHFRQAGQTIKIVDSGKSIAERRAAQASKCGFKCR
jgi:hypothetical protein